MFSPDGTSISASAAPHCGGRGEKGGKRLICEYQFRVAECTKAITGLGRRIAFAFADCRKSSLKRIRIIPFLFLVNWVAQLEKLNELTMVCCHLRLFFFWGGDIAPMPLKGCYGTHANNAFLVCPRVCAQSLNVNCSIFRSNNLQKLPALVRLYLTSTQL